MSQPFEYNQKKGKRSPLSFFCLISRGNYQHFVLWNDDAGRPAPL